MDSLIIQDLIALNPKVHSMKHDPIKDEEEDKMITNTKRAKGVSKNTVKKEITHEDYVAVLETNTPLEKTAMGIRSSDHQLYTFTQSKKALTSFYDKMVMVDEVACVPFGYQGSLVA